VGFPGTVYDIGGDRDVETGAPLPFGSLTLPVTVHESMGTDCEQGIHISLLVEQASIMDIDIKFPLIV